MGVVNVTPDSFSDGGRWFEPASAIAHGMDLFAAGAAIVDVGGESTRPGAEPVEPAEEQRRVLPVIDALADHGRISVDTRNEETAVAAVAAGATIVNDISAGLHEVAAGLGVGWVAMHMQGDPRTMQHAPAYEDVVSEVREHLVARAEAAREAGVDELWIDPGFGFGKDLRHNLELLAHLDELVATGFPVAVGISRKAFLGPSARGERPARQRARAARPGRGRHRRRHDTRPRRRPHRGIPRRGDVGRRAGRAPHPRPRRAGDRARGRARRRHGAGRSGVMAKLRGKWALGIQPRNFTWFIKDRLAVCERPGGFGENHRRVRRQEEIIWIREQGFGCVISIIPSPYNLHNYDELGVTYRHRPFSGADDPRTYLKAFYPEIHEMLSNGTKVIVHGEELGDRLIGLVGGYIRWAGLVTDGPQSITLIERISGKQLDPFGRSLVELAGRLSPDRR